MDDLLHTLRTYDPHDATAQAAMVGAAAEIERLTAWQEKVCAIVQPAQDFDEWGADVADIIKWRLAKLENITELWNVAVARTVALEKELAAVRVAALAVSRSAARDVNYTDDVRLVSYPALLVLRAALHGAEG